MPDKVPTPPEGYTQAQRRLAAERVLAGLSTAADPVRFLTAAFEAREYVAAMTERQRTLADARAVVQRECSDYPGASPAVTSGIWGGFDQWAAGEYGTLADPDRRLCGECGQPHTQYEYDDAHRNDEGGY